MTNAMTRKMTVEEREAFFREVHIAIISMSRQGEAPLSVPVWYTYGPDGLITITTAKASYKARFLQPDSLVSVCVQKEEPPYKFTTAFGVVDSVEEGTFDKDVRPLAYRYLGQERGDAYIAAISETFDIPMYRINIRPTKWLTQDAS